ncbi:hypothetical protein OGAPHI_006045 [Ogataea philodendri]|uniref:Thioredoxin domain-containing protein n=1 Tax=Ogataea philodendri TaxID=1378263 RepID=A0A9P8T1M8_9ASCO|nr:uncharacterized protein OGAPHI_006045 [Ogataea philodendri]KAH3661866.1 hypothetical protein OGAPHI_006045 [Ogataea philodendri]
MWNFLDNERVSRLQNLSMNSFLVAFSFGSEIGHISATLAHLTAVHQPMAMHKHGPWKWELASHQETRPMNAVEFDNLLANKMNKSVRQRLRSRAFQQRGVVHGWLDKRGVGFEQLDQTVLETAESEEVVLLRLECHGSPGFLGHHFPVHFLHVLIGVEAFVRHRIPAGVLTFVDMAIFLENGPEMLDSREMVGVCCSDESVVVDVACGCELFKFGRQPVTEQFRILSNSLSGSLDMLALLFFVSLAHAFYSNSRYVYELTPDSFEDVVFGTNHTTVVEFYAPWCGYCQQFRPHYAKAAKAGSEVAQFAAVDCNEDANKPLCNKYKIEGFPTVLVFRAPIWSGKNERKSTHVPDQFRGERTATQLLDFVKGRVRNYVKRVSPNNISKFLSPNDKPRVLLLTSKTSVSPMFKSVAIDYLGKVELGYITVNDKNRDVVAQHLDIAKLPQIVIIDKDGNQNVYEGPSEKLAIEKALSEYADPGDGELSERGAFLKGIKSKLYKSMRDFKKRKSPKSKKSKKSKSKSPAKDELHLDTCTSKPAPKPQSSGASEPSRSVSSLLTGTKSRKQHYEGAQKRSLDSSQTPSSEADPDTSIEIVEPEPKVRKTDPAEDLRLLKAQARLPLAERLRPSNLDDYIGQQHLVGEGGILRGFILNDRIQSMILWGGTQRVQTDQETHYRVYR